jgi:hypothetical protein
MEERKGEHMQLVLGFINSMAGLVAAIGTLLVGVGAVSTAWRKRGERRHKSMRNSRAIERTMWIIGAVLISISAALFVVRAAGPEPQPKNVVLTTAAWNAFNAKDYSNAIAKAQECIDEFCGSANREQAELEKQKVPLPPKGKVTEAEKQTIFARGLLNDVGTCYFILGRSAEHLGRKDLAREAYGQAARYTYARTWDLGGWFWSPAEAAEDRLAGLK